MQHSLTSNMAGDVFFQCKFCDTKSKSIVSHLIHIRHHRNLTKYFHCGFKSCDRMLPSEGALRCHVIRDHKIFVNQPRVSMVKNKFHSLPNNSAKFQCPVAFCGHQFFQQRHFSSHLKCHFKLGVTVPCPFPYCLGTFHSWHSFTGHMSRNHRATSAYCPLQSQPVETMDQSEDLQPETCESDLCYEEIPENGSAVDKSLIALAQFYQKLEFKHLIPESTVQFVSKELELLLLDSHNNFINDLRLALNNNEKITAEDKSEVISAVYGNSNIQEICRELRTSFVRKKFYKEQFSFIEPREVSLGEGKFFYYVPIAETLVAAFKNKSWNLQINSSPPSDNGCLGDFTDGETFINNEFFKENPTALRLIVYQDGFELVCPIGPAKSLKHKVVGVYMAIGNLPANVRFQKESIQLVALFKECEYDQKIIYGTIVNDILKLQDTGIHIPKVGNVKAGLAFIAGDNLGSHQLGGFIEGFSKGLYFCRYCLLHRSLFKKDGGETRTFPTRTVQSYIDALEHITVNPITNIVKSCKGVKGDSEFNRVKGFHVCSPGLPPCLGHDLFEGCVAYDLKLFIQYFVNDKKWFTHEELNHMIENFPYSIEDKKDKPVIIKSMEKKKLAGGAWQIWNFLRLFPLIVYNRITDFNDPVWKCTLQLREICFTAVAPEIHKSHLPSFQYIIHEYLVTRRELFPLVPLRPKHHYLFHYAELILYFGPLIKVWTLRFESKHTFFKRAWKASNNSINILKSMSLRHEFLQSWVRSGGASKPEVESGVRKPFLGVCYSDNLLSAVHQCFSFHNLVECNTIKIKGTLYSKGNVVIIGQFREELHVGMIHLILADSDNKVRFLVKSGRGNLEHHIGVFKLKFLGDFEIVDPEALLSYYPHYPYIRDTGTFICLKHALVKRPFNPL